MPLFRAVSPKKTSSTEESILKSMDSSVGIVRYFITNFITLISLK